MNRIRHLDQVLVKHERNLKDVMVLLGARQVGKTTILRKLFPGGQYLTVDNQNTRSVLDKYDVSAYRQLILPSTKLLVIDEIHQLKDPGRAAKIIHDQIPELKLVVTGSSSFDIKNRASESLAGRKIDYHLYSLSLSELVVQTGVLSDLIYPVMRHVEAMDFPLGRVYSFDLRAILDHVMLFGLYPAIVDRDDRQEYLLNLVDSVIFKDLLELSVIENRSRALGLLKLLAYQIGSTVNFSELAMKLEMDVKTVRKYINLFEQSFIIFTVPPFFRAKRKEIGKMSKIYFYDVGLRNALINDFNPLNLRRDFGALFENLIFSEVVKANYYGNFGYKIHYWRTTDGSEIDLVLEKNGEIRGLEIKTSTGKANSAFLNRYPDAKLGTINLQNCF